MALTAFCAATSHHLGVTSGSQRARTIWVSAEIEHSYEVSWVICRLTALPPPKLAQGTTVNRPAFQSQRWVGKQNMLRAKKGRLESWFHDDQHSGRQVPGRSDRRRLSYPTAMDPGSFVSKWLRSIKMFVIQIDGPAGSQ